MGKVVEIGLLKHQLALLNSKKNIAGIVGGRGSGKSIILSLIIALEVIKGHNVLALSQTFRTVKLNLMKEVCNRLDDIGVSYNKNYGDMTITCNGGTIYFFSYESLDSTRGITECRLLACDEIALAPNDLFETTAPCCRGDFVPKIRFCTTPNAMTGWNNYFKSHNDEVEIITGCTMYDNKFISKDAIKVVEDSFTDERMRQQEMYGMILDAEVTDSLFPSNIFMDKPMFNDDDNYVVGIDASGAGRDATQIIVRNTHRMLEKRTLNCADGYKVRTELVDLYMKYKFNEIYLDNTGGWSMGILEALRGSSWNLHPINFSSKASNELFLNQRVEMYDNLSKAIKNGFYVDDVEIKEELKYVQAFINKSGKKQLISKEEIKEIIRRSPDSADALAVSFAIDETVPTYTVEQNLNIALKFTGI